MVLQDGQRAEIVRHIQANFTPAAGFLREDEIQFGLQNLNMLTGLPIDKNTETHFSGRHILSGFDSYAAQRDKEWTDEERVLVEDTLRNSPMYGLEFVEIPEAPLAAPWPNYEATPPQKIVEVAGALSIPLEAVSSILA